MSDTNLGCVNQPRITDTPPASASFPPFLWSAPCPLPGLSTCCSPSSSAVLWGQGHDERCFKHPRYACPGLATTPTWPLAGHSHEEKVPGAEHRAWSRHQSQIPSSIFVYVLIFKPSRATEHSVLAVVQRKRLTKNINHIPGCCFLSTYRLYFYCISSYLKLILLF